jgi:RsiW-degrading membrane proteinase PrsW (M82 family)
MNEEQLKTLQWLGDQHFEEQRSLRSAEENLFNWSSSIFLAGLGALTSLKGISDASWSPLWRLLLILGVIALVFVILFLAYLLHRNIDRNQDALANIMAQLRQTGAAMNIPLVADSKVDRELFFYLRWSALVVLGAVLIALVWLLG